jgi:hypothetical protein
MKAIQVRYLAATNTKPIRLKAFSSSTLSLVECRKSEVSIEEQARGLAEWYILEMGWVNVEISGFGSLPNGDYVATIA